MPPTAQTSSQWRDLQRETVQLKHHLYELAVTNPLAMAGFLAAVHGRKPKAIREDFCGTAALARGWLQLANELNLPGSSQVRTPAAAVGVDSDRSVLRQIPETTGFHSITSDVMRCRVKADVIAATNFPVCYFHERSDLVRYLKHVRSCLSPRGVFACDLFGGKDAFTPGTTRIKIPTLPKTGNKRSLVIRTLDAKPARNWFVYEWHQRECNSLTGRVLCDINFELPPNTVFNAGKKPRRIERAFTYDWRLWSIPEMRDAMHEAGFRKVEVYNSLVAGVDSDNTLYVLPMQDDDELTDPYVVYVVAR